jgi:Transglycosylase SLT domain
MPIAGVGRDELRKAQGASMRDPRWVEITLLSIIRVIGAANFARASWASFGSLILAGWLVLWQPVPWPMSIATLSEARLPLPPAPDPGIASESNRVAIENRVDEVRPAPKLNKEQSNLARFIARRYQVALEDTQLFVDGAYKAARENKIDPWLILAVMAVESSFNPEASSHKGAQGLMQVLAEVHAEKFAPFGGVAAAFDPIANIRVGTRILREYISRDGSVENALKSYVGAAILTDDNGYGNRVLIERDRLAAAAAGKPMPEVSARTAAMQAARERADSEFALSILATVNNEPAAAAGGDGQLAAAKAVAPEAVESHPAASRAGD